MTSLSARSSMPRSINRLWMRISKWSQVAVPLPQGLLRVVTLSFLVGKGMGPRIITPVLSAIPLMYSHTWFILLISVLVIFILAFCIFHQPCLVYPMIKLEFIMIMKLKKIKNGQNKGKIPLLFHQVNTHACSNSKARIPDRKPCQLRYVLLLLNH